MALDDSVRAFGRAAVLLRCPTCGKGRIFSGFFTARPACDACGWRFESGRGEFSGVWMLNQAIVGLIAIFGYFLLWAFTDWPEWALVAWLVAWGLAIPIALYRNVRGAWIALLKVAERI